MNTRTIPTFSHNNIDATAFVESLHTTGFAGVTNPALRRKFDLLEIEFMKFAELSVKEKEAVPGYIYMKESAKGSDTVDLKGFIHINQLIDPDDPFTQQLEELRNHPFPIPKLLELAQKVFKEAELFAKDLLQVIETGLELEKGFLTNMAHNGVSSMRMLDYPPILKEIKDGAIRAKAHGDINLITVLPISRQGGLQVLSTQKDEKGNDMWIDAPTGDDMFVINTGDMMAMLTNDYLPSTRHRVINPVGADTHIRRLSFPFFLHPRRYEGSDTDLTALEKFVNMTGGVRKYLSKTAREYFIERMREINLFNKI